MSQTERWIVVGAGASGLATAFFLRQIGLDSVIIERDAAPGGRIGSVQLGGRSLDSGGKNIGRRYTLFRQFASSLGTHRFEYFGLNSSQVVNGKLVTFDAGARWRTMLRVVHGTSARDVVRLSRLLWSVRRQEENGYLGSDYARDLARHYDDAPVSHYFSPEFCRRIIRPMSVRMNGAEPDEIYMGNLGSNVRMLTDTYEQLQCGLGPLLHAALSQYDVRLNTACESLIMSSGRISGVNVRYPDGASDVIRGAGVVLTTPAAVSAQLTESILPSLAEQLRSVAYYPVGLIFAEYDRPVFSAGIRALVFGKDEPLSNAGAYGLSDLNLVRYTFSGRAARRYLLNFTDAEGMLQLGEALLAKHISLNPATRRRFVAKKFALGLCAYTPHHATFLAGLQRETDNAPGLHLTGDYLQGASIEACFRAARACVGRLATVNGQPCTDRAPACACCAIDDWA